MSGIAGRAEHPELPPLSRVALLSAGKLPGWAHEPRAVVMAGLVWPHGAGRPLIPPDSEAGLSSWEPEYRSRQAGCTLCGKVSVGGWPQASQTWAVPGTALRKRPGRGDRCRRPGLAKRGQTGMWGSGQERCSRGWRCLLGAAGGRRGPCGWREGAPA